jgi:hypothetical protein
MLSSLTTMGAGSFLGANKLGRGVNDPPTSSSEVKERLELYFIPLCAFMTSYRVKSTFTFDSIPSYKI